MKVTFVVGELAWISLMTGAIFESVRPARRRWAGLPWAREMAVCAPRPLAEGPVIRTWGH
jgi:hypothetical protein